MTPKADIDPADKPAATLNVTDLHVRYRVRKRTGFGFEDFAAVKGVTFDILPGEILGLMGESGSGKTTIGRAVLGLVDVSQGRITYGDRDLTLLQRPFPLEIRRLIQAVLQDPWSSLNSRRTVGSIIGDVLARHGRGTRRERAGRVAGLLTQVGLPTDFAGRYPSELSGGQRQRVSIARALSVEPRLIICDEVVSALDVTSQAQILKLLKRLRDETGVAILFISHDLGVVRDVCDRIAVMRGGEILELRSTFDVFENPAHPYTRELLAAIPGSRALDAV
jgi:ABC-type glutathione transport system ATPase component